MIGSRSISGRSRSGQFKYEAQNTHALENSYALDTEFEPLDWKARPNGALAHSGRRSGKLVWWALFLTGICLIVVLFAIKARALEAKAYVRQLQHSLEQEQASVQMLSAEIAHLESPARLQRLTTEFLDYQAQTASQIFTLEDAMSVIPMREDEKVQDKPARKRER